MNKQNYFRCTNCNKIGHNYKKCKEPVTSYGIILVKLEEEFSNYIIKIDDAISIAPNGIRASNNNDIELFSRVYYKIKFLMIRRKHTLGYIEFIRGRYKPDNYDGIIFLFQQMSNEEIKKIGSYEFDYLWNDFWQRENKKKYFENEYNDSKNKFYTLKNNKTELGLSFYVDNVKSSWPEPEWGFPKGRKNKDELELICAKREFEEETGFSSNEYVIFNNIAPLVEDFIGTNGVKYRHIYYVAQSTTQKIPIIDLNNKTQIIEIGDIKYVTFNDALKMIRPYHTDRKCILAKIFNFIVNNVIVNFNCSSC